MTDLEREELETYRMKSGNGQIAAYYLLAEELGVQPHGSVVDTITAIVEERDRYREALEMVRRGISLANAADVDLFMRLGLDESEKWDQPSRNLQTFSYVLQEIDRALRLNGTPYTMEKTPCPKP
jgi:hypothetical protein